MSAFPPESPFLKTPESSWIASNSLAFGIPDGFPVSPGHTLVVTRRLVPTWFDATPEEQAALMELVGAVKALLDASLVRKPDGYNVGFNAGQAAGQTVPHVHLHVIPRYAGDVPDPRGGVRHVIPGMGNYLAGPIALEPAATTSPAAPLGLALTTGHPREPLWRQLQWRLSQARHAHILSSFVQTSGLELIAPAVFSALQHGATIRILAGDYLCITDPEALRILHGWCVATAAEEGAGRLEARLWELQKAPDAPRSFHPKAWQIQDADGVLLVVGSSNLSRAALLDGIEWNLLCTNHSDIQRSADAAFEGLWNTATPLSPERIEAYATAAAAFRKTHIAPTPGELPDPIPAPRPWQVQALRALEELRADGCQRALVTVATGMGKTWLAAFDLRSLGRALGRRPRVLVVAHRAHLLSQAERTLNRMLFAEFGAGTTGWCMGADDDLDADLVLASIQKLARPEVLERLAHCSFDYAVVDEVHHAEAPSYRRMLARLSAGFVLGLTATPERADGIDVAALFDDNLAHAAGIADGIEEGALVPFHYFGIKDTVDFRQIPWRNGRFDPEVLEARVLASERMRSLESALQAHPAARSLFFCVSRRHALFTRDWLRQLGCRAAAVFSGPGSDPADPSLRALEAGELEALCVVDMFNEGLDLPAIDRVILLRPTESKVVFLQQLGRGLRAIPGKERLILIDFVGNHRIFAQRMLHLLGLRNRPSSMEMLRLWIEEGELDLPPGCLLEVEWEAKQILHTLLPRPAEAAIETYRGLRETLGRRPTLLEVFLRNITPKALCRGTGGWFEFLSGEGDLSVEEARTLEGWGPWLRVAESTALNKSYKMVVLRVLLDLDAFWTGLDVHTLALACRRFLRGHPRLRAELQGPGHALDDARATDAEWTAWWLQWPLRKWLDPQQGRSWFALEGDRFRALVECAPELRPTAERMLSEIVEYRLMRYLQRLRPADASLSADARAFVCKVSHASGRPILFLPSRAESPEIPQGQTPVRLPNGEVWEFHFVKVACNRATRGVSSGGESSSSSTRAAANALPGLLREWFGPQAGMPGTHFTVCFECAGGVWSVRPAPLSGGFGGEAGDADREPTSLRVAE
ncbi:MAG: hypothetical protein RLZZ244_1222, partial [Verrucomicrobiota bacterium]